MGNDILYRSEQPVRRTGLVLLLVTVAFWFAFFGYGLLVRRERFTPTSAIGTGICAVAGLFSVVLIVKGGKWYFEANERGVLWLDPFAGRNEVLYSDADSFAIEWRMGAGTDPPQSWICILLKSGQRACIPTNCVGDQQVVCQILAAKWQFLGRREKSSRGDAETRRGDT